MKPQAFLWEAVVPNFGLATYSAEKCFWFFPFLYVICGINFIFLRGAIAPSWPRLHHCPGFTITLRHTTLGRTPLDEWSARRTDVYLTNTRHSEETFMSPAVFELAILTSEQPQIHTFARAATGILPAQYHGWLLRNNSNSSFATLPVIGFVI